jgi:hypothetical protein
MGKRKPKKINLVAMTMEVTVYLEVLDEDRGLIARRKYEITEEMKFTPEILNQILVSPYAVGMGWLNLVRNLSDGERVDEFVTWVMCMWRDWKSGKLRSDG